MSFSFETLIETAGTRCMRRESIAVIPIHGREGVRQILFRIGGMISFEDSNLRGDR